MLDARRATCYPRGMPDRSTTNKPRVRRAPGFSRRLARYSVGTLTLAGSAGIAQADFSGMYSVNPPVDGTYTLTGTQTYGTWTSTSNNGTSVLTLNDSQAPASLTLTGTAASSTSEEQFTHTAPFTGTLSFSYTASGVTFLNVNGSLTFLNGTSSVTNVAVGAGQTFGFLTESGGSYTGSSLTVSNFSAPGSVPEPGAAGWIAAGAAGLLATRALRRRSARAAVQG